METSLAPCSLPATKESSGFRALDELVRDSTSQGFYCISGPQPALDAVTQHIARRAYALGRSAHTTGVGGIEGEPWHNLGIRHGIGTTDPLKFASQLLEALDGAVVVIAQGLRTSWGRTVAEEVARLANNGLHQALVLLCEQTAPKWGAPVVHLRSGLTGEDLSLWWDALAVEAQRALATHADRLDVLETWWAQALGNRPWQQAAARETGAAAKSLLTRLVLSQRPWQRGQLGALLDTPDHDAVAAVHEELHAHGLIDMDVRGFATAKASALDLVTPQDEDVLLTARALEQIPSDPWAWARASELFAKLGMGDEVEALAMRAIAEVRDATARADFWHRYGHAMTELGQPTSRLLHAAEAALRCGDADVAYDFARAAATHEGEAFDVMLTLGRATTARGDLTTAAILLNTAMESAPCLAARARAAVEMAEVRYKASDFAAAEEVANEALCAAADLETRLLARNVLGKLLLTKALWGQADQHFAADAWEAARGGNRVAELRANLNRGVTMLSCQRLEEARAMLTTVLEHGEELGELRAKSFALTNLAVIAIIKHEYVEALKLSERAIDVWRSIGDRVGLSIAIANLAELRLRIGLVSEAEQVLAFGRRVCGAGLPGTWAPHFDLVAAQIHLAKGRTADAKREIDAAIASAAGSNHGGKLGECYAFAARIALEDGNLSRAKEALEQARKQPITQGVSTEVALLQAMLVRAGGEGFAEDARHALDQARKLHDTERAREAHLLLCHAAMAEGDMDAARDHLEAAVELRDRLAGSLPEEMRLKFLGRKAFEEFKRLEASLREQAVLRCSHEPLSRNGEAMSSRSEAVQADLPALKRLVGQHPTFAMLLSQVQKVGASNATVFIHGESGTGKELVAEAIHEASPYKAGPLIKVNCSALVETLLLSELFGHERGSFTGATARRRGRFELAEGGTLFLDEIGDISAKTQVALLRVLQDKIFERVGGVTPIRANVRVICATHRDLRTLVARGLFREDLYYRLRQVVLEVPSLRQRRSDLPLIATALLTRIAEERRTGRKQLSSRAVAALMDYDWPGNVRELENALRAAALFSEGDVIDLEDFTMHVDGLRWTAGLSEPPSSNGVSCAETEGLGEGSASVRTSIRDDGECGEVATGPPDVDVATVNAAYAHIRSGNSLDDMRRDIERACIAKALDESRGNITRAAVLLGVKRPRLSILARKYGVLGFSEDES